MKKDKQTKQIEDKLHTQQLEYDIQLIKRDKIGYIYKTIKLFTSFQMVFFYSLLTLCFFDKNSIKLLLQNLIFDLSKNIFIVILVFVILILLVIIIFLSYILREKNKTIGEYVRKYEGDDINNVSSGLDKFGQSVYDKES